MERYLQKQGDHRQANGLSVCNRYGFRRNDEPEIAYTVFGRDRPLCLSEVATCPYGPSSRVGDIAFTPLTRGG